MRNRQVISALAVIAVVAVCALTFVGSAAAASGGSICLAPGSFDAFAKGGATVEQEEANRRRPPPDPNAEAVRYIRVDGRTPVRVTSREAGRIAGLSTVRTHTVVIAKQSDMSEPVARFAFTFKAKGSPRLCLWYETFYGSWILRPLKGSVCHCDRPVTAAMRDAGKDIDDELSRSNCASRQRPLARTDDVLRWTRPAGAGEFRGPRRV